MSLRRSLDTMPAGGQQPNQMRSALVGTGGWEPWCIPGGGGWEPWSAAGGIENGSSLGSATTHDVTVADEDIDILECGICYCPLKPPIFQCAKGHVVCSPCYDRLKDAVNCHVCRVAMPDGYQRCHAMERVVDSIRMQCPHAAYGCNTKTAYYARDEHLLSCPHVPCRCPGDACGFIGSVETLVNHIVAAHGWPCSTEVVAGESFSVDLWLGFNFLIAVRGSTQYLLLLNMASTPFGHAISAVWIRSLTTMATSSSAPATSRNDITCELELCFMQLNHVQLQHGHYERSRFQVECMCPSNGLPDPNASFQFFVPNYAGGNEAPVNVSARILISDGSWGSWT